MSTHLNRRPDYDWDFEAAPKVEQTPKYQAFNDLNSHTSKLKELVFFAQLAVFCVTTALLSFFFLSLNLSAIIALPLSCGISFGLTRTLKHLILND